MEHLIVNNLINPSQQGFVPKRFCMTQQLEALEFWTKTCDQGSCVDIAFMDIQKAYDTVPHKRPLEKLNSLGFETKLLTWIEAFLSHQEQRVIGNNKASNGLLLTAVFHKVVCLNLLFSFATSTISLIILIMNLDYLLMMLNCLPRWVVYWTVNPYKMTSMQYLNGLANGN